MEVLDLALSSDDDASVHSFETLAPQRQSRETGRRIQIVDAINLLEGSSPVKYFRIGFFFDRQYPVARITMRIGVAVDYELEHELRHCHDWEQLGAPFRRSTTVQSLMMGSLGIDGDNNVERRVSQSIQALFRGFQSNTAIEKLEINLDLIPCDGSLPTFNLQRARFKASLKSFILYSHRAISNNQSHMIVSFLESSSLKEFEMAGLRFDLDNEEAFRRIILASLKVEKLRVKCATLSQYAAVATLLGDSRSILSEVDLFGKVEVEGSVILAVDEEGLSTIATTGLANNTTVKKLILHGYLGNLSPMMTKALCDTSSIQSIQASNHTMKILALTRTFSRSLMNPIIGPIIGEPASIPFLIKEYLRLNKSENKELVIRTKIARYYFQEDFDVSTFASMDMKCLPRVLAMIGGGETNRNAAILRKKDMLNQRSAIFRMLKCIPELCNVSSRDFGRGDGREAINSSKRRKFKK